MTDAKQNRLVNVIIGVAISAAALYFTVNVVTFYMPSSSELSSAVSGSTGAAGGPPAGGQMPPNGAPPAGAPSGAEQ